MNRGCGKYGPERYVEAHIWSDDVIKEYVEYLDIRMKVLLGRYR